LLLSLSQQAVAPPEAQRRGGRTLLRGCHEQVIQPRHVVDDGSLCVDRNQHPLRFAQSEGIACMGVAGLLEAYPRAVIEKRLGQQVEGLLGAHGDHDLLGQREDAALG
jgi:hypothetical protein